MIGGRGEKKGKVQRRNGKLARMILLGMLAGAGIVVIFALPGIGPALTLFKPRNARDRYRMKSAAERLENEGLLKTVWNNGKLELRGTRKGIKEARLLSLEESGLHRSKQWDGKWRMLIFDIPEKYKNARMALSKVLNLIGMYPIQRSVFVYPDDCWKELDFVVAYFGVKKYVHYAVIESIDAETELRHVFSIT